MSKLLLLSVLIAATAIPIWAAREPNPRKGLKKAIFYTFAFNAFYLFALRVIYPRL
jgi:hypothetical protein